MSATSRLIRIVGVALSVALTGVTVSRTDHAQASSPRQCIDLAFAGNWTKYDDHTILVDSGPTTFRVTATHCPRLADPMPRISTVVRGANEVCGPHDVDLFVGGPGGSAPCFIDSIAPLTRDEARAMRQHRR